MYLNYLEENLTKYNHLKILQDFMINYHNVGYNFFPVYLNLLGKKFDKIFSYKSS